MKYFVTMSVPSYLCFACMGLKFLPGMVCTLKNKKLVVQGVLGSYSRCLTTTRLGGARSPGLLQLVPYHN